MCVVCFYTCRLTCRCHACTHQGVCVSSVRSNPYTPTCLWKGSSPKAGFFLHTARVLGGHLQIQAPPVKPRPRPFPGVPQAWSLPTQDRTERVTRRRPSPLFASQPCPRALGRLIHRPRQAFPPTPFCPARVLSPLTWRKPARPTTNATFSPESPLQAQRASLSPRPGALYPSSWKGTFI